MSSAHVGAYKYVIFPYYDDEDEDCGVGKGGDVTQIILCKIQSKVVSNHFLNLIF